MGRLIDAELTAKDIARYKVVALERGNDEMNKIMECYINPTAFSDGVFYGMELAQKVVYGQPTAYDIDKVVEELNIKSYDSMHLDMERPITETWQILDLDDAIEIVKKGGAV